SLSNGSTSWLATGAGSIAGARLFQRTLGFKVGGNAILRTGASGIRGGGAFARRNAGFGKGTAGLVRTASGFVGLATGAGCGLGLGSATIEGFFRRVSTVTASGSSFLGLRDGVTVRVK